MQKKIIGVACIIAGVVLIVWGRDVAQSLGGQFERAVTGAAPDKALYMYIGGAILGAVGLGLVLFSKK